MRSGAPSSREHSQHVVMAVAVVDLQRLVEPLGEADVPPERLLLRRHTVPTGAEVVEPGLPHDPDPRVRREPLDLGVCRVEPPALGECRHLVGVQRDSREHPGVALCGGDGELGTGEVAPDLDDAVDADGCRVREDRAEVLDTDVRAVTADVEMGVVVHHGNRQRVGWLPGRHVGSAVRSPAHGPAARASSSSTTDSSSLVKTGAAC